MSYLSSDQSSAQSQSLSLKPFEGDPQFAMTLAKGLELLNTFTHERPLLSNKELSERLAMSKSTVSRFTYTLSQLGYITTDKKSGKFQLGSAVLSISYPLLANMGLRQLARPLMSELAESIQGSVSMGIQNRLHITYVETSRHRSIFNTRMSDIGLSVSIAASAIGRAYLCGCSPEKREILLNNIRVKEPEEWKKHESSIKKAIEEYNHYGFCISKGEIIPDVYGVGVPFEGNELIVFNCVVHSYQYKEEALRAEIGPRLVAMVKNLKRFMASTS